MMRNARLPASLSMALFVLAANTQANTLDTLGIKLGASRAEAETALKAVPHAHQIYEETFARNDLPAPLVHTLRGGNIGPNTPADIPSEKINVYVTAAPATAQVVWKIQRTVNYAQNAARPSVDTVQPALLEKYGATLADQKQSQSMRQYSWVYDQSGKALAGKPALDLLRKCSLNDSSGRPWGFDVNEQTFKHIFLNWVIQPKERVRLGAPADCAQHRFVKVQLNTEFNSPTVGTMSVSLVDLVIGLPALEATFQSLDQSAAPKQPAIKPQL